jgi:hypothetical protein
LIPRSRSATTASGCTACCTSSISARRPARRSTTTSRALHAIGEASLEAQGLDEAAFLPFSASFAVLVPRYVGWLHRREAGGASWSRGEADLRAAPAELGGIELQGRVDRIDAVDGGRRLELIDYKTGSASQLKKTLLDRFEDTQLAFYAALVGAESDLPLQRLLPRARFDQGPRDARACRLWERARRPWSRASAIDLAPPARGRRPAAARRGTGLRILRRRAACAARPLVADRRRRCCGGRRERDERARLPHRRRPGDPCRVLRDRLRSGAELSRRGLRRLRQDLDPGVAHAARLLDGAEPHEILAITFTRAAAGEMRERPERVAGPLLGSRSTHADGSRRWCSAASRLPGPRRSRTSSPRSTRGCLRLAGRSRSGPFTPGSRSCCGWHRWPCSIAWAWRRRWS